MDLLTTMLLLWRRQRYEYLNASRIICKTPGYLVYAHLGNGGSNGRKVTLYDGENTNEQKLATLAAPNKGCDQYAPSIPTPFNRGLYADVESDDCLLTVVMITKRE